MCKCGCLYHTTADSRSDGRYMWLWSKALQNEKRGRAIKVFVSVTSHVWTPVRYRAPVSAVLERMFALALTEVPLLLKKAANSKEIRAPSMCLDCYCLKMRCAEKDHGFSNVTRHMWFNPPLWTAAVGLFIHSFSLFSPKPSSYLLHSASLSCRLLSTLVFCCFNFPNPASSQWLPLWELLGGINTALTSHHWCPPGWQVWL